MSVTDLVRVLESIIDGNSVDTTEANLAEMYAVQEAFKEAKEDGYLTEEILVNFIDRASAANAKRNN